MSDRTHIEWTDATWNPTTGCTEVSPGCDNCYARRIAEKFAGSLAFPRGFAFELRRNRLLAPLKWAKPRRIFVDSMSDLFHRSMPLDYLHEVFEVMNRTPQHQYQILTKRPERAALLAKELTWSPNIWMGTSVELQRFVPSRLSALLDIPAAVRFLSCEPLLGILYLTPWLATGGIHWVITGGESGPGRRPADPDWFRFIRDQCLAHGVAFFHKQGNAYTAGRDRRLDGHTWDEYPSE